jgi:hypothetical protein
MTSTIPISKYIPVTSSIESVLSNKKVFAGLSFTANAKIPTTQTIKQFTSLQKVGEFFGTSSQEYAVARTYFTKKNGVPLIPPYIYFGKWIITALAPYLKSGVNTNTATLLTTLQAVTAGDITVSVDGTTYPTTAIDLSTATSLSDVASKLTTAIITANTALDATGKNFTITYDGVNKQFVASIPATGSTSTMNYFSSTNTVNGLATLLQFTLATNAVLSQGSDALNTSENLTNLSAQFTDQFCLFFNDDLGGLLTDVINLEVAQWVSDAGDKYNFNCWSNEVALESKTDTTSIKYLIDQAELNNTSVFDEIVYNNAQRASAYAGIFASIDLTQPNSAISPAWKSQDGLLPSVTNKNIADILDTKKINYYGSVGLEGTTQEVNFFYGGYTSGKWEYTDNLVGQIWLAIQCQINLVREFTTLGQIANDPDGQTLIRTALTQACETAITSGVIVKGLTFDSITASEVKTQYGANIQELTNNGYIILNTLATSDVRQARQSSVWAILYAKGSAIQYVPINTTTFY